MTKDVQQAGGPFEQQSELIGLPRQITIDTTNNRILIHDGETPGGIIVCSRDEGDSRWMVKIAELLGFADLGVGVKGFAVRQAAGVWVIRQIIGDGQSIEVIEGFGENGNPEIGLSGTITKDLVFQGDVTFESVIQGEGFIGDTQGDHTGNVQGNVQGNVTGDLTGDSQGLHVGNVIGGLDARDESVFFDAEQIPMAAIQGLQAALDAIPQGVPIGTIVWWHGDTSDVPAGWALCDGDNGTPDLRDRFILCAGPDNDPHTTGGSATFTPAGIIEADGVHSHNGTVAGHTLTTAEMPAHAHGSGVTDDSSNQVFNHGAIAANPTTNNSVESNSADGIHEGQTTSVGGGNAHDHGLTIDDSDPHAHMFTGTEADSAPPFYCVCAIMKV